MHLLSCAAVSISFYYGLKKTSQLPSHVGKKMKSDNTRLNGTVPNSNQQPVTCMEIEITIQTEGMNATSLILRVPRVLFGGCIPTDREIFLPAALSHHDTFHRKMLESGSLKQKGLRPTSSSQNNKLY